MVDAEQPRAVGPRPAVAVFDLGGVLIDWDPRHLYRSLFDEPDEMETFLEEVSFAEWNARQDAGRPFAEAVEQLAASHPHRRELIDAFMARWHETLAGEIPGTVEVLRELKARRIRLFALSNWSAETFPVARERFGFLAWFEGIVISGEIGAIKPGARPFEVLVERHGVDPATAVFIDDSSANVEAAARLGFRTIRFTGARNLRADLVRLGMLPARRTGSRGPATGTPAARSPRSAGEARPATCRDGSARP